MYTAIALRMSASRRILIPYVGKVPGTEFPRGVTAILGHQLMRNIQASRRTKDHQILSCYLSTDSRAYGAIPNDSRVFARYAVFERVSKS